MNATLLCCLSSRTDPDDDVVDVDNVDNVTSLNKHKVSTSQLRCMSLSVEVSTLYG